MVSAPGAQTIGPAIGNANMSNAPQTVPPSGNRPGVAPLYPSVPAKSVTPQRLVQLQSILQRFEVSIAEAQDLVVLEDYEIVMILDDSGSMKLSSKPAGQRSLFEAGGATRWDELKESAALLIDLACCFDRSGVDVFFLNNGLIDGVKSAQDERLRNVFDANRLGTTPLTETVQMVAQNCKGERPILLIIFTDGEPNGGIKKFEKELKRIVTKKSTDMTVKVQIMACTADQDAVGYLNDIDEKFGKVDVTDDFYSEQHEVVVKARKRPQFTRGDWLMKALLGPITHKFDDWDETGKKKKACKHCDDSDCSSDSSHDEQCDICVIA